MLLRTALLSVLAAACCQIGYGQYPPNGSVSSATNRRPYRLVAHEGAAPAPEPAPPVGGNAQMHVQPQMDYGMPMTTMNSVAEEAACDAGGAAPGVMPFVPWWHRHLCWSYWKVHGLPSPWCTPGNMSVHLPCNPCMGTYYYFRPYHWFHVGEQQQDAAIYEGDPRNPYDNRVVFDGLYDGL